SAYGDDDVFVVVNEEPCHQRASWGSAFVAGIDACAFGNAGPDRSIFGSLRSRGNKLRKVFDLGNSFPIRPAWDPEICAFSHFMALEHVNEFRFRKRPVLSAV